SRALQGAPSRRVRRPAEDVDRQDPEVPPARPRPRRRVSPRLPAAGDTDARPTGFVTSVFGLRERATSVATEVRAGLTTFMVMAYIIFVNPIILGYVGVPGLDGKGLPFGPTLTVTCLTAGLLSIAMGVFTNYPFALAPGMGLNAVVAFELVAGRGLTWPQAMTIVFLEGVVITLLVLTRFREAMLEAVPLGLKRAISVGIGLFIAFIGFFTAGFVVKPNAGPLPVGLGPLQGLPIAVFLVGFVLTAWLMARRVRGALLLGIVLTTIIAIALNGLVAGWKGFSTPGAAQLPRAIVQLPDFSTFGRLDFGVVARLGIVTTMLVTFSIMLSDFFDTMGTIIGVGGKGGFLDREGRLPDARRVLLVDSLGAVAGGLANGIGAGFVTYVAIKLLNGRGRYVHWMLYVAAAAFVVYFAIPFIERRLA